ncbi:MAG TPA: hypothetical protein VF954_04245 [Acidimicrobiales bacterium]
MAATDYRSWLLEISPGTPGLEVTLLDLGRRIRVSNRTGSTFVVVGYSGEPYLRIGPHGVDENLRSPATYQNRVTPAGTTPTTLPAIADAHAEPAWRRVSGGTSAVWRDRRTRWEGPAPQEVRSSPGRAVPVSDWFIELDRGDGTAVVLQGRITFVPAPSAWPWLVLAATLAALAVAAGLARRWGALLSCGLAVLVATDVARNVGGAAARGGSVGAQVARLLGTSMVPMVLWVVAALAMRPLERSKEAGLIGAGIAALGIGVYSGVSDIPNLFRSQEPVAFAPALARLAVAVSLGLGIGITAAVFLRERRFDRGEGRRSVTRGAHVTP